MVLSANVRVFALKPKTQYIGQKKSGFFHPWKERWEDGPWSFAKLGAIASSWGTIALVTVHWSFRRKAYHFESGSSEIHSGECMMWPDNQYKLSTYPQDACSIYANTILMMCSSSWLETTVLHS